MTDERFKIWGPSWSERAALGDLRAVISPTASDRKNRFFHGVHSYAAHLVLDLLPDHASVIDFGCGNGRFSRLFADHGHKVLGTEITPEMLDQARASSQGYDCAYVLTDGIHIPADDASVDAIWSSGVLRFSLFSKQPVYAEIAAEMFRVLRPGGQVFDVEMYIEERSSVFLPDMVAAGFRVRETRLLQRYNGFLEKYLLRHERLPESLMPWFGKRLAQIRYHLDLPDRVGGLRDFFFAFEKPR